MNSNNILSSDLLDILFDKRNKKYGAYILRKFYPDRVKTSLFIMLGMAAIFSAFTFLPGTKMIGIPLNEGDDSVIVKEYEQPKEKKQPKEEQAATFTKPTQKLTDRILVADSTQKADSLHDITNREIAGVTSAYTFSDGGPGDVFQGTGEGPTDAPPPAPEPPVDITAPVADPDILPSYPGGDEALIKFLQRNLESPEEMDQGNEVQVRVTFLVGYDGNLEGFNITKDGGKSYNGEVIRVLKKMPRWNPGKKSGRSVPVYFTLPVKFAAN